MRKTLVIALSVCAAVSVRAAVEVGEGIEVPRDASTGLITVTYSLSATAVTMPSVSPSVADSE